MTTATDVTVILCTYNRAMWLRNVLDCLLRLRTDGAFTFEIVVVDNASTDDTPQIVADVIREAPLPMRYLRESHPGPSAARNRGIAAARGAWLAFVDDDELADPNWLFELLRMAEHKRVRVVGGAVQLVLSEGDPSAVPPALESVLVPGGRRDSACRYTPQYALNSGNQMLASSVFDEIGMYSEKWTEGGEDTDLFSRIYAAGIEAWYTPTAVVRHLVPSYRLSPGYLQWLSLRQGWTRRGKMWNDAAGCAPECSQPCEWRRPVAGSCLWRRPACWVVRIKPCTVAASCGAPKVTCEVSYGVSPRFGFRNINSCLDWISAANDSSLFEAGAGLDPRRSYR